MHSASHPRWKTAPYRPKEWTQHFDLATFDLDDEVAGGLRINSQVVSRFPASRYGQLINPYRQSVILYSFANSWGLSAFTLVCELNDAHQAGCLGGGPWELRDERPRPARAWTVEEIEAMLSRHDFPESGRSDDAEKDWMAVLLSLSRLYREPQGAVWVFLRDDAIARNWTVPYQVSGETTRRLMARSVPMEDLVTVMPSRV
ncbi:hypothetical protein P7C70_g6055, partial [Phenoliferia sp. Uapishka_3]